MKSKLSILIIEDDKYTRLNLRELLRPLAVLEEAENFHAAQEKLSQYTFDIVLTDIELGDHSGLEIIPYVCRKGTHCIVISSFEGDEVIEKAYTLGASHFLSKFRIREQLPIYINKFLQNKNSRVDYFLREEFITQDEETIKDLKQLLGINLKNKNLFISGPSGSGKSLLGKLVHEMNHPEASFIHLNCSEIPENLLESELFGHEKGAFTGADTRKEGKLKLANGGTLFLDEVATMPQSMQQKLLKAIDEKTFYPVGATSPVKSDFTLISATCENIQEKIRDKSFREDLFYRLSGFQFKLKSIQERPGDIEPLLKYFQKKSPRRFVIKPEATQELITYHWPGNIREIKKVCDQLSEQTSGVIEREDIHKIFSGKVTGSTLPLKGWQDYIQEHGLKALISLLEKNAVEDSLKRHQGKVTASIKELKISSSAFYRILQEHKINV